MDDKDKENILKFKKKLSIQNKQEDTTGIVRVLVKEELVHVEVDGLGGFILSPPEAVRISLFLLVAAKAASMPDEPKE